MKTICFVLSASNTKGANGAFLELIDGLDKNIFTPVVLLPTNGPIESELRYRNIQFRIISYKWWVHVENFPKYKQIARLVFNIITLPFICWYVLKWRADIIYTNTIVISSGLFAAIVLNKPHVFYIHEFGDLDHKLIFDFGRRISVRLASSFSEKIIFASYSCLNYYRGFIDKDKCVVVYQSVTIPTLNNNFLPRNIYKRKLQCVIVGRLHENKGQKEAIEAVSILIDRGLDVGLWIIGDGDLKYTASLKQIVKEKNIESSVSFLGYHEYPFEMVKEADVFLMCSRSEAFGRVTVEAMLMSKPVIGLKRGGTVEIVQDGFSGFLYDQSNYKDLAEKIRFFYQHQNLIKLYGDRGKKRALEMFNQRRYAKDISIIFYNVLKK